MNSTLTIVLGLVVSGSCIAETWTVDDDGKADFDNIQAAVDAADSGDTIEIFPGVYSESVEIWNKVLTIQKADSSINEEVIIDGTGLDTQALLYVSPGNHGTAISGITFQDSPNRGLWVDDCNYVNVINCKVQNNSLGGMLCSPGDNTLIKNCKVLNNTGDAGIKMKYGTIDSCLVSGNNQGSGTSYSGAIRVISGNATVSNSVIHNNDFNGGGGISLYGGFVHVVNCTLFGNSCAAFRPYNGSMTIENTIVWGNEELTCSGTDMQISFSCLQESWPGENNFVLDPLFNDPYLYTISEDSPCVDTGSNSAAEAIGLKYDLGGNPRYVGESVDIGAWEFQSSTCPDINNDGNVDVSDLLIVIGYWGTTASPADVTQDGIVDVSDILLVISNWGPCE